MDTLIPSPMFTSINTTETAEGKRKEQNIYAASIFVYRGLKKESPVLDHLPDTQDTQTQ